MKTYLANSLSINMIGFSQLGEAKVFIARISPGAAHEILAGGFESAVGHESTAALIAADLCLPVRADRQSIKINPGDKLVVAQYVGPRLPEGATELPPGARLDYFLVEVSPYER
jgi:hypothetical protein